MGCLGGTECAEVRATTVFKPTSEWCPNQRMAGQAVAPSMPTGLQRAA